MKTDFKSKIELTRYYADEENCKKLLAQQRWNSTEDSACPHCGNYGKNYITARGYKCRAKECGKKFTVTTGTIFENTKIKLNLWFEAIFVITAHKKGISSHQLAKDIDVSQKTAWFILHRVREMLKNKSPELLSGVVEADETYVGGLEKNKHAKKRVAFTEGKFVQNKTMVAGVLQRKGEVRLQIIGDTSRASLIPFLSKHVKPNTVMCTDTWKGYNGLQKNYFHLRVDHSKGEYKRGMVCTNGIENFWSQLKRGIDGIYHHVTPKHLERYCDEFAYRYNSRKIADVDRFTYVLTHCEGRLKWDDLTANHE